MPLASSGQVTASVRQTKQSFAHECLFRYSGERCNSGRVHSMSGNSRPPGTRQPKLESILGPYVFPFVEQQRFIIFFELMSFPFSPQAQKALWSIFLAASPFVLATPAFFWICGSRCRAWQPDCYAWKAANCTNPCLLYRGDPNFNSIVVAVRNLKPRLREINGITDKGSCQAKAPIVAAAASTYLTGGNKLVVLMSVPYTRCVCDQAF